MVRLLISVHLGILLPSPGEVTGRHRQIIVSWRLFDPLTFLNAPIKQLNINLRKEQNNGTNGMGRDREQGP